MAVFDKSGHTRHTYFTDENVGFIEMSSEHLGRFAGDGVDFDADLLALPGRLNLFVVALDARHDANVEKLKR